MRHAVALTLLAFIAGCTPNREQDISTAQTLIELGDAVNDLRQDNATLQQQIDSLRLVVARQDTVVRQVANLAGVPVSR